MSVTIHTSAPAPVDADSSPERQRLEESANTLRSRLARTLESLGRRRHDAFSVKAQARRHPLPLLLAGTGALVAVAGSTGLSLYRARQRRGNQLAERLRAVARAWQHPERVARPDKLALGHQIVRGVLASLATYAITQLAKHTLIKFFPSLQKDALGD